MKLPESVRTRLRNNRWLFGGLSAALIFFTVTYYLVLRSRDIDPTLVNNQILLFTLRNVNAVLVLTIVFVLIRNLFKLWVERRSRILGAKFKTKLVATYIGLTLIPVLLLFAYATELLQGSIDNLFRTPGHELLEPGHDVAQELTSQYLRSAERDARTALAAIGGLDLRDTSQRPTLNRHLRDLLRDLESDFLAIYEDTEFLHAVVDPQTALNDLPEVSSGFLLEAVRNGTASRIDELPTQPERLILAAAAVASEPGAPSAVVVSGRTLGAKLSEQTAALVIAYQSQRQLEVQLPEIKTTYMLLFLMVTLVILLTSSWMGMYLARRVTVPIQALADGTRRISSGDLSHRVSTAADDELGILVNSFNDMTAELQRSRSELVASNQQLSEERALIAAILENVAAGVIAIDGESRVLLSNQAALHMLELDEADVLGRRLSEVCADEERAQLLELFEEEAPTSGRLASREIRMVLEKARILEATASAMKDDQGRQRGWVLVLEDLTELIEAQKLATWNEAARRIAHEIKNPLTPIKLSAERLLLKHRKRDPNLGSAIEEAAAVIAKEVASMKTMVDEFSRFARMPPTQLRKTDVAELLEDTVSLYRDVKPGVEVRSRAINGLDDTPLDREQMRSALVNLIDNAVEATDAPGSIEVEAERQNGVVRISVADTGRGIPPQAREKLFLPYYSTKGRGTGLGLAIVHRIVSDHHGTIRVDENRPKGSIFTIEIPS